MYRNKLLYKQVTKPHQKYNLSYLSSILEKKNSIACVRKILIVLVRLCDVS